MIEICVWTGGDRNHLSLWDRLDGHVAGIKEDGWPWSVNETGGNHRVIRVATDRDLRFLRKHTIQWRETAPNKFERDPIARCGALLPEAVTQALKNTPEHEIMVLDYAFLMKGLRVAADGPTVYMTEDERAAWYKSRKARSLSYWFGTTARIAA